MSPQTSSSVQKLHFRFRFYGKNAREWMRKCVLMLPELERERVWEKKGYDSLSEYAGRLSGMSKEMVYEGLRVLRAVEGMPDIMRVIEERGIGIVRPVLTLLTRENQQFWAEKMQVMSLHTLQMYRRELEQQAVMPSTINSDPSLDRTFRGAPEIIINSPQQEAIGIGDYIEGSMGMDYETTQREPSSSTINVAPEKIFAISLKPEIIEQLEKLNGKDGDWNTLMQELLELRTRKLKQEKPPEKQTLSRHIPVAIERFVVERSRGICEVGACRKTYTILHHVQRFASEKVHDPDRIIALCTAHERLVHLGLIEDESIAPRQWKILEEADRSDKKYLVDQMVQKYRRPG